MPRIAYIRETFFDDLTKPRVYKLTRPDFNEPGFYQQTRSLNAFFFSTRNPIVHVTFIRQFTIHREGEPMDLPDVSHIEVTGIYEFYKLIGYDRKNRKYLSGERMKTWNDKKSCYNK